MKKILVIHNSYQQPGGEDVVVESEVELLRSQGHEVLLYQRHNDELGRIGKLGVAMQLFWSTRSEADIEELILSKKPDIIHVHNTFPLISPSVYWLAAKKKIPIVQTLHNFRLNCPQGMFLRKGLVCEDCLGHAPWRGAIRGCYRGSVIESTALAAMVSFHRGIGTWSKKITRYIALNEFCRDKFIQGGLPPDRISIKPNFVDIHPVLPVVRSGFFYAGRLSVEKGIETLQKLMLLNPDLRVRVAGEGPEARKLRQIKGLTLLGSLNRDEVRKEMNMASALIVPSIWYENCPMVVIEAFAMGLPVIASNIGALSRMIDDGVTGLLFDAGSASDLAIKIRWCLEHPEKMAKMGSAARAKYEVFYTPKTNYQQLISIYRDATLSANILAPISTEHGF